MGAQQSFETFDPFLIDHISSYLSDPDLLVARTCCKKLRRRICPPDTYKLSSLDKTGYIPGRCRLLCEFKSCALFENGFISPTAPEGAHWLILKWDSPAPYLCMTIEQHTSCGIKSFFSTSFGLEILDSHVDMYNQYALTAISASDMRLLWMLKRWHKDEAIKAAFIRLKAAALLPWESVAACCEWYPSLQPTWKNSRQPDIVTGSDLY